MDHKEYTTLKLKNRLSIIINPEQINSVTNHSSSTGLSMGWTINTSKCNIDKSSSEESSDSSTDRISFSSNADFLSAIEEISISCDTRSRKPKRLNSNKPKPVFPGRQGMNRMVVSLPFKAFIDRSSQRLLCENKYFNLSELTANMNAVNFFSNALSAGLCKIADSNSLMALNQVGNRLNLRIGSLTLSNGSHANSNGALQLVNGLGSWNCSTSNNPFRTRVHCRVRSHGALTSSGNLSSLDIDNNNTTDIDLTDLGRVLESTLDQSLEESTPDDMGPASGTLAASFTEDLSVEELSGYFEDFCHIPKKMSLMAELMYA